MKLIYTDLKFSNMFAVEALLLSHWRFNSNESNFAKTAIERGLQKLPFQFLMSKPLIAK